MRITPMIFLPLLASCNAIKIPDISIPHLTPYHAEIRQGNFVTPEMREKLKLGMSKQQVSFVLGTPLLSDIFHANRWDYVYFVNRNGTMTDKQSMSLFFEGDNLARIEDGAKSQ